MTAASFSTGKINILLMGGGGREHAIALKLSQSPRLGTLYTTHSTNPGLAAIAQPINVPVNIRESYRLVHFHARHRADAHLLEILFDDVGNEPHTLNIDDVDNRRVGRDVGPRVRGAPRDEAVDRRRDDRVLERDAQLVEAGLRLVVLGARQIESGLRRLVLRFRVVERLLRQQLALEQVARAFDVRLCQLEIGFALAEGCLAYFERGFRLLDLLAHFL